jgi:glyoxylase-like metal-dependent hydrolase (beta-lactamase superfamily II)
VTSDRHAWEQAGAFEVVPGVHRIPLPLPSDHLKAVNVYAISEGERIVLIDGGWNVPNSLAALEHGLSLIDHRLSDIREFLVTHVHRDHYTLAVTVRRSTGSSVALGEAERSNLVAHQAPSTRPDPSSLRLAGAEVLAQAFAEWAVEPDPTDWEDPDRWLTDGLDIPVGNRSVRAIATPGHTRGHLVFHDATAGVLFAGDHVLPHISPSIGLEMARTDSPLADYLNSLRLVLAMPDAMLLPAHGPVVASTHARVEELLAHHDQRLTFTAQAVERGASTGYDVSHAITWTRHERSFDELDFGAQTMAVRETMAHLQVLVERGWLRSDLIDGVAHFSRA